MPFRDSSVIARFFTEEFGLQSFVVNGVRSSRSKISPAIFQALMPVDLVQYHDQRKELHRFSEIRTGFVLQSIPLHPVKSALAMFVAEYLSKILKDHLENRPLFEFSLSWIRQLDNMPVGFESAHLGFIWHSFSFLGISPESWEKLIEHSPASMAEYRTILQEFLESESPFAIFRVPSSIRQYLLDALVQYAHSQMDGMGEIKSLAVLRQVFL